MNKGGRANLDYYGGSRVKTGSRLSENQRGILRASGGYEIRK